MVATASEASMSTMSVEPDPFLPTLLLSIARTMLYPSFFSLNHFLGLYYTTFEEDRYPLKVWLKRIFLTPVYAALLILFLPLAIVFLPIRCLLLSVRRPFLYSEVHTAYTHKQGEIINDLVKEGDYRFGIASANLCLMPELISKMNHITRVDWRARKIGERIIEGQMFNDAWLKKESMWKTSKNADGSTLLKTSSGEGESKKLVAENCNAELVGDVTTSFPHLDFLVIQEAWSTYHNKALIRELHKVYPYIVHDVGVHSVQINHFLLNSGLLFASRHPVVAVDFKPFTNFILHGKLLSKGVLMTKITVGRPAGGKQNVGYIFNTHLQSYQGSESVIPKQLNEVLNWSKQFVKENTCSNENVVFNFLCGDFNMDNLSPSDSDSYRHAVFDDFVDVCRVKAGCDKPWTVGTEMRQDHMFDSLVTSPEGLKAVLDDPALRQSHLVDGDIKEQNREALVFGCIKKDEQGNVKVFPEGGRRRIDYIMYQRSHPVNVKAFHFVTQLASLTDHIPVAMEFNCPTKTS